MATQYYRFHGGRLTLTECWCLARSWTKLFKLLAWKPLGGYPFRFSIPRQDRLNVVDPDAFPAGLRDRFLDLVAAVEKIGFQQVFVHRLDVLERSRVSAGAVLLDSTGTIIGTVAFTQANRSAGAEGSLTTHFTDGTAAVTTTARRRYRQQPHRLVRRHPGTPPAVLLGRHREYVADWERAGKVPRPFTRKQLPAVILEAQQRYVDFQFARGLFVPMTEGEIERARGEVGSAGIPVSGKTAQRPSTSLNLSQFGKPLRPQHR